MKWYRSQPAGVEARQVDAAEVSTKLEALQVHNGDALPDDKVIYTSLR